MSPDVSLSHIKDAVEQVVASLPKEYQSSPDLLDLPDLPDLPDELNKFTETMQQIEQGVAELEILFGGHEPAMINAEGINTTLSQFQDLLEQYQKQFEESMRVQHGVDTQDSSAENLAKLRSLRRNMKYSFIRVTFTSRLRFQ